MIPALMSVLLVSASPLKVVEVPVQDASLIRLSMVVRAPADMTQREQAAWHALMLSARTGNTRYPFHQMVNYGLQGDPSTVLLENSDDLLFVHFAVPRPEDPTNAAMLISGMAQAIAFQPKVGRAEVEAAKREMALPAESDLRAMLTGYLGSAENMTPDDVRRLWVRAIQPGNVAMAGSSLGPQAKWDEIMAKSPAKWPAGTSTARDTQPRSTRWLGPGSAQLTQWGWTPMTFSDQDAPSVLALIALGTGKSSAAFRTVREQLGASYLQTPYFLAGPEGWEPRMVFGSSTPVNEAEVKSALMQDIERWDSSHLARAIMLADRSLKTPYALSPFFLRPSAPWHNNDRGRTDWAAYSSLTDSARQPEELLERLNRVKLDDMKAAAKSLIENAIRL